MNILLIEDEPKVISLVQRGLESSGHTVSVAMDGHSGFNMSINHSFDVIILDLMLPGKSGMEICREIRQRNQFTPILMLTALSSTENIVSGLDMGADDYMTKPFKLAELEARVRNLTRRNNVKGKESDEDCTISMGDLELNFCSKIVKRGDKKINLLLLNSGYFTTYLKIKTKCFPGRKFWKTFGILILILGQILWMFISIT